MGDDIPTVVSTAEVQFGSVTLVVHHLDNGQRVIDASSMAAFVDALSDGTLLLSSDDAMKFAKVVSQ